MSLFHSILSQLQAKLTKETALTETIAAVISATMGTTVTKDQLVIHGTTLRIKSSPTLKMAIALNKDKILNALKEASLPITTIV